YAPDAARRLGVNARLSLRQELGRTGDDAGAVRTDRAEHGPLRGARGRCGRGGGYLAAPVPRRERPGRIELQFGPRVGFKLDLPAVVPLQLRELLAEVPDRDTVRDIDL